MSQTKVVQEIRGSAGQLPVVLLSTMGLFSQMFSGQASDEGSIFSISSMCLLQYMGFDGFLSQVHLLHSLVPAALVAGLALCLAPEKRGVALVVGLNCFWPEIFSYFGKHLYCYQYAPEVIKQNAYECPFLPDFAGRVILRIVALVLMVAISGLWIWLSLHKGRNTPLHVLYLTKPYRSGVALWETERLFRKTALTMAVSALPITSSPALQVVCIGSIVSVSLLLYATLLPYKAMRWNLTECVLLFAAALMTTLVSGLTAYDSYWGHVVEIEYAMIVATLFLAGCVFTVMPYLIYSRLKLEWSKECSFQLKDEVERTLSETNDTLLWSKFI
ncbi:unnamed protein product [Symbiodinium sp. CCMP2456]|nr:unnamed protein product [Symbiodinium sp. CCMP2456]